jgi:UPF0755 protein
MIETLPRRSERPPRRRRGRAVVILLALVLVLIGGMAVIGGYYQWAVGASGPQRPIVLTIPQGATGSAVADLLKREGVIRSPFAFRLISRFRGFSSGFQAGKYHMKTNLTVSQTLDMLKVGPFVESISVTIPEGYTVEQTAARAAKALKIRERSFVKLATNGAYSLPPYLPKGTKTLEGFLFPSTYDFLKDIRARDVVQRLLDEFRRQAAKLPWDRTKELHVTPYQAVIVASLIEREAGNDADRAKIAAVIYNRLARRMPLGIDATVRYAVHKPTGPLTVSDLNVNSPYNTRKFAGLPPTPIASPGFASLKAALEPAKVDYLYFVVVDCSSGKSEFATTYAEFLRLKAKSDC